MPHKYHVAGLGNAIVDIFASVDDAFLLEHKIAKGAMTLTDEFRAFELNKALETAGKGHEAAGGSLANSMAGLASLGAKGVYVGKVHADRLGAVFSSSMKSLGIDYSTPLGNKGSATASSLIAVTPDGQRSMNTYLGACRELTPDDVDANAIAASNVLYIEGYLWDQENSKASIRKAIAAAKGAGRKVAFTCSDPFCVGRYRSEFLDLMQNDIDILFANEAEAMALFEAADFDSALASARAWKGLASLTRSEKGCVIAAPNGEVHVLDAAPVARVIDTTGAGDQFAAGFLFGMSKGMDLRGCAKLGGIAAAEVISHYGARPEMSLKLLEAQSGF